jgi:RNA polymerase sporulation-specific sigma factor
LVDYKELPLLDVIEKAKNENDQLAYRFLIDKYKGFIHSIIKQRELFKPDGDYADLFQEGMHAIYKAVLNFNPNAVNNPNIQKGFESFLRICITCALISAVKMSTRQYNLPLNKMVSLDQPLPENENLSKMDIYFARDDIQHSLHYEFINPEEQVLINEKIEIINEKIDEILTPLEKTVHTHHIAGKTYKEIEQIENIKIKAIDNAIQRAKKKLNEKIKSSKVFNPN